MHARKSPSALIEAIWIPARQPEILLPHWAEISNLVSNNHVDIKAHSGGDPGYHVDHKEYIALTSPPEYNHNDYMKQRSCHDDWISHTDKSIDLDFPPFPPNMKRQ